MSGPEGSSIKNPLLCVVVFILCKRRSSIMEDIQFMELAYQQALIAKTLDEIPVGAIIVNNNQVIASGYNYRETTNKITSHAEINAIEEAAKILHSWKLDECTLYVTLEPCMMCSGAIIQSKIKRVVFGAYENNEIALSKILFQTSDKEIRYHPTFTGGILEEKCSSLIIEYFKNKRRK